jgi:hypothetical protein
LQPSGSPLARGLCQQFSPIDLSLRRDRDRDDLPGWLCSGRNSCASASGEIVANTPARLSQQPGDGSTAAAAPAWLMAATPAASAAHCSLLQHTDDSGRVVDDHLPQARAWGRCAARAVSPPLPGRALALPCLPTYIHSHVYTNQSHQQSVSSNHPTLLTTCALRADPLPRPAFRTHDDARTTAPACSELFSPASAIDSNVLPCFPPGRPRSSFLFVFTACHLRRAQLRCSAITNIDTGVLCNQDL